MFGSQTSKHLYFRFSVAVQELFFIVLDTFLLLLFFYVQETSRVRLAFDFVWFRMYRGQTRRMAGAVAKKIF